MFVPNRRRCQACTKQRDLRTNLKALCKRYGTTVAWFDKTLEEQGGACAICRVVPEKYRLHIDHCHSSGRVRGLLCNSCNTGIGHFHDDPERLARAIGYVLSR